MTYYNVIGIIELQNPNDPSGNPVRTIDQFHSQFQLQKNKYRDNNNFLRYNQVKTRDNRFNFLGAPNIYKFVDYIRGEHWIGGKFIDKRNVTFDGVSFEQINQELLFGAYYFYSRDKVEHARDVQTYFNILSEFGGLC